MSVSGTGASSIGTLQHPLVDPISSPVEVPYLQRRLVFTILAIVAVGGVIFGLIAFFWAPIFVLGALGFPVGTIFLIKNRIPLPLQPTEVGYRNGLEKLVKGALYSVSSFPGNLCQDLGRGSRKKQIFSDLSRQGCLLKTREKTYVLAPESLTFKGLETVSPGDQDSFSVKIRDLLRSNGITDENEQENIIGCFSQGLATDCCMKLHNLFDNNNLRIFFVDKGEKINGLPRLCLDLTRRGVAQITFKWEARIERKTRETKVLAIVHAAVTIFDHRDGKNSNT